VANAPFYIHNRSALALSAVAGETALLSIPPGGEA